MTYLMMDAMTPVTILSQFFQKENVDVALIKVTTNLIHLSIQIISSMIMLL